MIPPLWTFQVFTSGSEQVDTQQKDTSGRWKGKFSLRSGLGVLFVVVSLVSTELYFVSNVYFMNTFSQVNLISCPTGMALAFLLPKHSCQAAFGSMPVGGPLVPRIWHTHCRIAAESAGLPPAGKPPSQEPAGHLPQACRPRHTLGALVPGTTAAAQWNLKL